MIDIPSLGYALSIALLAATGAAYVCFLGISLYGFIKEILKDE